LVLKNELLDEIGKFFSEIQWAFSLPKGPNIFEISGFFFWAQTFFFINFEDGLILHTLKVQQV
jgi:hypothetical protein